MVDAKTEISKVTLDNIEIPIRSSKVEGEIDIIENGKHDVSQYASANVQVPQGVMAATIDMLKGYWTTVELYDGEVNTLTISIYEDNNGYYSIVYSEKGSNSSWNFTIEEFNLVGNSSYSTTYDPYTETITLIDDGVSKTFHKKNIPLTAESAVGKYFLDSGDGATLTLELNADNTFRVSMTGEEDGVGTYRIENGQLVLKIGEEESAELFTYDSSSGDFLFQGMFRVPKTIEITENGLHDISGNNAVNVNVAGKNFMPYLVNYVEQEDGTYEMQITDYIEGGEGEKVLIGTDDIDGTDLMNLYIVNAEV